MVFLSLRIKLFICDEIFNFFINVSTFVFIVAVHFIFPKTNCFIYNNDSGCSPALGCVACCRRQLPPNILLATLPGFPFQALKINEEISEILKNLPEAKELPLSQSNILFFYSALAIPLGGFIMFRIVNRP